MAPLTNCSEMGNTFSECLNAEALTEAVAGTAGQLFERKLRTGHVDESDVLNVLTDRLKQFSTKLKITPTEAAPPKDIYNVRMLNYGLANCTDA